MSVVRCALVGGLFFWSLVGRSLFVVCWLVACCVCVCYFLVGCEFLVFFCLSVVVCHVLVRRSLRVVCSSLVACVLCGDSLFDVC